MRTRGPTRSCRAGFRSCRSSVRLTGEYRSVSMKRCKRWRATGCINGKAGRCGGHTEVHTLCQVRVLLVVRVFIPTHGPLLPFLALVAPAVVLVKSNFDIERVTVLHHTAEAGEAGVIDKRLPSCLVVEESVGCGAVLPAVVQSNMVCGHRRGGLASRYISVRCMQLCAKAHRSRAIAGRCCPHAAWRCHSSAPS